MKSGTWSAPAFLTLTGGSVGAQIGGQEVDLLLVVIDEKGLEQLVSNQFKLGADAGVSAGPVGRNSEASTDVQMRAKILSYSRSRGLFAGVTLNGASLKQDRDANERFYGQAYRTSHDHHRPLRRRAGSGARLARPADLGGEVDLAAEAAENFRHGATEGTEKLVWAVRMSRP